MKVLVDGDVLAYYLGFALQNSWVEHNDPETSTFIKFAHRTEAKKYLDKRQILDVLDCVELKSHAEACITKTIGLMYANWYGRFRPDDFKTYLTNEDSSTNFRYGIFPEYKQNRAGKTKPLLLDFVRDLLICTYDAEVSVYGEADDTIGRDASPEDVVISTDKDLWMIPGIHYNMRNSHKTGDLLVASDPGKIWLDDKREIRGYGLLWFWSQMLTGDKVDNIPGLKGYGAVKAYNTLCGKKVNAEAVVIKSYKTAKREADIEMIAKLLWVRGDKCPLLI